LEGAGSGPAFRGDGHPNHPNKTLGRWGKNGINVGGLEKNLGNMGTSNGDKHGVKEQL